MANTDPNLDKPSFVLPMRWIDLANVAAAGAAAGLVTWLLFIGINQIGGSTLFCNNNITGACQAAPRIVESVALIGSGVIGLLGLVRFRAFRPLLVVLAVIISLGGLQNAMATMPWYTTIFLSGIIFALGYATFAWLSRFRSFVLAVIANIIIVVVVRLVLF